jgi:GNAT superfamily N-acetyltransferase
LTVAYEWRGSFGSTEVNALHADAFDHRVYAPEEWDWRALVDRHSLGWVTARSGAALVGFVNVPWDGFVHAWIQDTMVATDSRHQGVATELLRLATVGARDAGCEWLHVDFDDGFEGFYIDACGFTAAKAGLIALTELRTVPR